MARVPIEEFVGYTDFGAPLSYETDGSLEVSITAGESALRPLSWGVDDRRNALWSILRTILRTSSQSSPEPTDFDFFPDLVYNRTSAYNSVYPYDNPFTNLYPFNLDQTYQFLQLPIYGGNYNYRELHMSVLGHRIPFTLYYTVQTGVFSPASETLGSEQSQVFSRDAGWEHILSSPMPEPGTWTRLTNVRMSPV